MAEARQKVIAALIALLVQIILLVSGVCIHEDSTEALVVGVEPSAKGVPEPR